MTVGISTAFEALESRALLSASPTPGGMSLGEVEARPFTERLGEVTVRAIDLTLNAHVNWGDGTRSDGRLVGSYATGEYYVTGTHTYAAAGTYKVTLVQFSGIGSAFPGSGAAPVSARTVTVT